MNPELLSHEENAAWNLAMTAERAARQRALTNENGESAREWWQAIRSLCDLYACLAGRGAQIRFPAEVAFITARLSHSLADGIIPDLVRQVAAVGAPSKGVDEARDIGLAVAYRLAAKGGIPHRGGIIRIEDRRAVFNLADWYGVDRTTVQGWVRSEKAYLPDTSLDGAALSDLVRNAGERYQHAGRGAKAIRRRAGC